MKERESWIDSWKGILILLVVLGHVAGMMYHFSTGEARAAMRYVYRFIYLFHMPAFFLLAGVLAGTRGRRFGKFGGLEVWKFGVRKFNRLLIPYFFWGVVSVVVFLLTTAVTARMCGGATDGHYDSRMFDFPWWRPFVSLLHAGFWPNGEGFRCNSVLWFLPCMFCVLLARKLLQHLTTQTHDNSKAQTLCLAILCLILGGALRLYVGPLPWCLDRVPRFLAFVYLGEMIAERNVRRWWLMPGGLMFAIGVVYFPDLAAPYFSWGWYFAEAGMALLGGALSMVFARIVDCRGLAGLGCVSLGVMLVHKFPVVLVQSYAGRIGSLEVWMVGGLAVGVTLAVTAVSWLVATGLRRWAPWSVGSSLV